jgi:hypothetical protein
MHMADHARHCPFLNRADDRCSTSFSLDHLQRAFGYCFGSYEACPMYAELLAERRIRRGATAPADLMNPGCATRWADDMESQTGSGSREVNHVQHPVVQLTLSRRELQHVG